MSKGKKPDKGKQEDEFDFLGKLTKPSDMKIDLNDPKLMKELQGMGWGDDDNMDIDPDLAELEKQIDEEEKNEAPVHHGKEMTAEEIENAHFDEDDLNDPALLAELEDAEDPEDDKVGEVSNRIEELKQQIEISKQNALKEKARGNKEAALDHLKLMKSLQAELESSERLLTVHKLSQKGNPKQKKPNDAPPPDEDFDYTTIVSVSVLDYEKERSVQRNKSEIVETIEMQITIITNNINFGILSQEAYVSGMQDQISEYKKLIAAGNDRGTYSKHIQLMEQEIQEMSEMQEEEEVEEVAPPAPVARAPDPVVPPVPQVDHQELMHNIRYKVVYESFEEGKEAFTYLKNLGKEELCVGLLAKLEKWQEVIKTYRAGKEPTAEIKPLGPQDITGMPEEERKARVRKLMEFCTVQIARYKDLALAALRLKDKEQAIAYKREMTGYENKTKRLDEALKNPWQIPPEVSVKTVTKSVPQINEDVEPGALEITYGKAAGLSDKEDYIIAYSLVAGDTLAGSTEKLSKICEKGVNHTFTIKVDQRNFGSLFKKHVIFEVFEYHRLRSNKSMGTCNVKLEGLAKQCTFKTLLLLARKGPQIDLTFRINKSLTVPETKQIVEKVEYVEDLCVPFKSPEGRLVHSSAPHAPAVEERKVEETKDEGNFDDIAQDEYENPNVIRNLLSFEVLEVEIERLKKIIIDTRSNGNNADKIMNLQRELMKNKSIIEAQVGNGVITPQQYKEVIQNQVQHDIRLAQFYKQRGKKEHLLTVVNRVKIMKKEIEELNNS